MIARLTHRSSEASWSPFSDASFACDGAPTAAATPPSTAPMNAKVTTTPFSVPFICEVAATAAPAAPDPSADRIAKATAQVPQSCARLDQLLHSSVTVFRYL